MKLKELIKMYEEELQDILKLQRAKTIKDISLVSERIEAQAIHRFLKNLKNLPNELQDVNNNEWTQEKCTCNCSREVNIINGKHICTKCNKPL